MVVIFAEIIKIVPLNTQEKLKDLENLYLNETYISISSYSNLFFFLVKNVYLSRTQRACCVIRIYFESPLGRV